MSLGTMTAGADLAQDPGELFDVVTATGEPTGRAKRRAEIHRDGDWHRALHVWVAGKNEHDQRCLIFQRRSAGKDTWPNRFDATVGGHVRAGETLAETMREIEEEIGLAPEGLVLRPLGVRVCVNEAIAGVIDREIQDVFLLFDDRPLTAYRPNPVELAALARFPLDALVPFLAGELASVEGETIRSEATTPEPVIAYSEDFVPNVDRYFLRVAIAALNALRGDRFVAI